MKLLSGLFLDCNRCNSSGWLIKVEVQTDSRGERQSSPIGHASITARPLSRSPDINSLAVEQFAKRFLCHIRTHFQFNRVRTTSWHYGIKSGQTENRCLSKSSMLYTMEKLRFMLRLRRDCYLGSAEMHTIHFAGFFSSSPSLSNRSIDTFNVIICRITYEMERNITLRT